VESYFKYSDQRRDHAAGGEGALSHSRTSRRRRQNFWPLSDTINSTCEPAEYEITGRKLKWHLRCKGQLDLDISGNFNFESRSHYTAAISSKGWMAGALISDVKTELEGERVGECQQ
jgi:hypothetical protein